jgi:hypothetical protein
VVLARREKASEPQVAAIRRSDGPAYIDALIRDTSLPAHKVVSPCPATWQACVPRIWHGCGAPRPTELS